jgi:hypothetical protein
LYKRHPFSIAGSIESRDLGHRGCGALASYAVARTPQYPSGFDRIIQNTTAQGTRSRIDGA